MSLMEGITPRFDLSATTLYIADLNGEEMNLHAPKSYNSISKITCLIKVT